MIEENHPEMREDEVFLGNFEDINYVAWKSRRVGQRAYDASGLPVPELYPVFAKRSEIEATGIVITPPKLTNQKQLFEIIPIDNKNHPELREGEVEDAGFNPDEKFPVE